MTDPTPTPPPLDLISHNHGPEDGGGMACREHRTGDCIIRELTARAEAAEAKIAAVREMHHRVKCNCGPGCTAEADCACGKLASQCQELRALDGTA